MTSHEERFQTNAVDLKKCGCIQASMIRRAIGTGIVFDPDREFTSKEKEERRQTLKKYRTKAKIFAAEAVREFGFPKMDTLTDERRNYIRSRIRNLRKVLEEKYYLTLLEHSNCSCYKKQ